MKPPVYKLKKTELVWLNANKCKHGHTYLEHYNCFLKENPNQNRIGFFDIEVSNLKANVGLLLCYCIKDFGSDEIIEGCITPKDLRSDRLDEKVVRKCVSDLSKFDRIVTYYGTGFDIPYIRSKAVHCGIDFPCYGEMLHTDLYYIVRNKFKLTRSSLKVATQYLLGDTNKTEIDWKTWIRAGLGHQPSLDYVLEHCRMDVVDTQRLYEKIMGFKKETDLSI